MTEITTATKVAELRSVLETKESSIEIVDIKAMNFNLADAIREGAGITEESNGWGNGEQACALHSAVISASARGYMKLD